MRYLMEALEKHGASLFAYCLMGNHYHLLIAIAETPLSVIMHGLLTRYALYFNSCHDRVGHLFQGRYFADLCGSERSLIERAAYVHLNPVRAAIAADPADWAWSGHRELLTGKAGHIDLSRLLDITGMRPDEFREAYVERVAELLRAQAAQERQDLKDILRASARRFGLDPSLLASGSRRRDLQKAKVDIAKRAATAGYTDSETAQALRCSKSAVWQLRNK